MSDINWDVVSENEKVIELIKQREKLSALIRELDPTALVNYELEILRIL